MNKKLVYTSIFCLFVVWIQSSPLFAKDLYIQPTRDQSRLKGDGTRENPWSSLQLVLKTDQAKPGDAIWLKGGFYGNLLIYKKKFDPAISIKSEKHAEVQFSSIVINKSSGIKFKGLTVSLSFDSKLRDELLRKKSAPTIIRIQGSNNISIDQFGVFTSSNFENWTKDDWANSVANGILTTGNKIDITNSVFRNVKSGINSYANNSKIENNLIEHFAGDGLRALGNNSLYQGNTIQYCYQVDKNHADGIQSWSVGEDRKPGTGTVSGSIIRANKILNTGSASHPFKCNLQGIGMFDGMFNNWIIENNLILVNHWHGITVLGATNVKILNNTVVQIERNQIGPPRITIGNHKKKIKKSYNNIIANNLLICPNRCPPKNRSIGAFHANNLYISSLNESFVNYSKFNFHLRRSSPAVDGGYTLISPKTDMDGQTRFIGKGVDVGAYESW